jgi:circadian clock protein KaiC
MVISTGNQTLDHLIGGGIQSGKNTILVGDPGSGKTALAVQFISDQSYFEEFSAYICIDKKPEKIMQKAIEMTPSIKDQIKQDRLKFVEISCHEFNPSLDLNEILFNIQSQLDALFNTFPVKRLVIDSLLPHFLHCLPFDKKQYFIRELLYLCNLHQATTMCVLHDLNSHQTLWLDTDLINDQLIFHKKCDFDYATYWIEVSRNNKNNISGKYRFTFDYETGLQFKHRLC